jgi:hypothetical protein
MGQTEQDTQATDPRPASPRRWWLGAVAALAVLVVVTVAVFASGGGDGSDGASAGQPGASTATSTADGGTVAATEDPGSTTGTGPADTVPGASVPGASVPGASTSAPQTTIIGATSVPGITVPFTPGSLATVPVQTVVTAPPVAIDDVADAGTGMTFRLAELEAVDGEASGPGEIAGPAVRVTVIATNSSVSPVSLEGVVVDLIYGATKASAAPLSGPGVVRFEGQVAPGASATGVYVFDVPVDQRGVVTVLVSYLASVSPVVFEGPAPTP